METFCTDDEEPVVVGDTWSVVIQQHMDGLYSPPFKADIVVQTDEDGDGHAADVDCDDTDPDIYPGAAEVCDEVDNNCNDEIDEGLELTTWWPDTDGDGYGGTGYGDSDPSTSISACSMPEGYVDNDDDCNDDFASFNPDAQEVCDEIDNDCDTFIDDEDDSLYTLTGGFFYGDGDGDGYGDASILVRTCDAPDGYVDGDSSDCDDSDGTIHPDATEICDGVDNDCDTFIDDDDPGLSGPTFYADDDGDGHGDAEAAISSCLGSVDGYVVSDDFDCDDTISGSTYVSIDADCDGSLTAADCNDYDPSIYPGATEIWYDGVDQDCGGETLSGGYGTDYDADGDGFRSVGYWFLISTVEGTDCNDANPDINPGATEIWYDGVDQDCDDAYDYDADSDSLSFGFDGATDCDDTDPESTAVATDGDCDSVLTDDDCDDTDPESTTVATDGDCDSVLTDDDCDDTDDETPAVYDCPIYECFTEIGPNGQASVDAADWGEDWWVETDGLPPLLSFGRREMLHDFLGEIDFDAEVVTIAEAFEVADAGHFEQNFCAPTLTLFLDSDGDFKGAGTPFDLGFDVVSTRLSYSYSSTKIAFKVNTDEGIFESEPEGDLAAFILASFDADAHVCCDVMDDTCSEMEGSCLYLEFAIDWEASGDIVTIPDGACHPECDECDGDVCPSP
jgi:hypothetical protein